MTFLKNFALVLLLGFIFPAAAQKSTGKPAFPSEFNITAAEYAALLGAHPEQVLAVPTNKYLDRSLVIKNVTNGDMQFVRLKLNAFKNAYLTVQVNGQYSTHIFIMSDDNSVFYKGSLKDGAVLMEKCSKDEIVVE